MSTVKRNRLVSWESTHDNGVTKLDIFRTINNDPRTPFYWNDKINCTGGSNATTITTDDTPVAIIAANNATFSAMAVVYPTDDTNGNVFSWSHQTGDQRVTFLRNTSGQIQFGKVNDAGINNGFPTTTATVPKDTWSVIGVKVDSTTAKVLTPNRTLTTMSGTFPAPPMSLSRFSVGGRHKDSITDFNFEGYIRAVLVWDDALDDAELEDQQEFLLWEYVNTNISVRVPVQLDLKEFGVEQRTDITSKLQRAVNFCASTGTRLQIPGGFYYLSGDIECGAGSTDISRGLVVQGAGAGDPGDYITPNQERSSGFTAFRWIGNNPNRPMFRVRGTNMKFTDFTVIGGDIVDRELDTFFELEQASGVGTGELRLENIYFFSSLNCGPNVAGIKTSGAADNEDESSFKDLEFFKVAFPLHITQHQAVGWYCYNWRVRAPKTAFRFDGGGKLYVFGGSMDNAGTGSATLLDLRGSNTQIRSNTGIFQFRGFHLDGGSNSTDVTLVKNTDPLTAGESTPNVNVLIDGMMAMHDTQTVRMVDLVGVDGEVVFRGCQGIPRLPTGANEFFAHFTSASADPNGNRALLAFGVGCVAFDEDVITDNILSLTSDVELHLRGLKLNNGRLLTDQP